MLKLFVRYVDPDARSGGAKIGCDAWSDAEEPLGGVVFILNAQGVAQLAAAPGGWYRLVALPDEPPPAAG